MLGFQPAKCVVVLFTQGVVPSGRYLVLEYKRLSAQKRKTYRKNSILKG
jgi:hypothetical protein